MNLQAPDLSSEFTMAANVSIKIDSKTSTLSYNLDSNTKGESMKALVSCLKQMRKDTEKILTKFITAKVNSNSIIVTEAETQSDEEDDFGGDDDDDDDESTSEPEQKKAKMDT